MKVNLWDRLLEEEIFSGFEEEERNSLFLLFSRLNDRKSFKNYILEILNLKRGIVILSSKFIQTIIHDIISKM